ncbi:MAG: methionyl-tRNA formyltransferase [Candidatus Marinimicrobia bacterium]|nr:methionyl-tRNA formyltransferase [Candidatus Neomarinimicrobiota bacterium]
MRIIFMGNPAFAIPSLKRLMESSHNVVAVVSNPEKRMGRGKTLSHTPIGQFAIENNLNLIQASSLYDPELHSQLLELKADLNIVVAYRILPQKLIEIPKTGSVNLHASLLPKYRGAAPIQWALMNGDHETGISTFFIEKKVDTGKIIHQQSIPIDTKDDYDSLSIKLSELGSNLLLKSIDEIESGKNMGIIQDHSQMTRAPKITRQMTQIIWNESGEKIANWIRGLSPKPGMFTQYKGKLIRLFNCEWVNERNKELSPGHIYNVDNAFIDVVTGNGLLRIYEVQLEGKRRMTIQDFLAGNRIEKGEYLGDLS